MAATVPALALLLSLAAAAGAPAAAQESRPALGPAPGAVALTDREQLLVSLLSGPCGAEIAFAPGRRCFDRSVDGKGVGCTRDLALDDLVRDLTSQCTEACAAQTCGMEDRQTQCALFGFDYKKNQVTQNCKENTAPKCPGQDGFVCRTTFTTCTCVCPADA